MRSLFFFLTTLPDSARRDPYFRRVLFLPLVVAAFSVLTPGCSFLQPDFSAGRTEEPATTSTSEEPQVRSVTLAENAESLQSMSSVNDNEPAPAEPDTASSQQLPDPNVASLDGNATVTADTPAGPLNDILGDNVPEVTSPGEGGPGAPKPQLSGLTPLEIVAAQDQVLRDIYVSSLPSVVYIRISRNLGSLAERPNIPDIPNIPDDFFERSGGSGFVWDDEGHIVTNHHVVTEADRIIVMLPNRVEMEAEFLGSDPDSDLAVLKVSDPDGFLKPSTLGNSDKVDMGQLAAAVGNPFGQEFSITAGIVSGIGRTIRSGHSPFSIPEVIQTDAPINPGNSGGPLLDRNGHVIGVNTQIISHAGGNSGIGFAVPINIAKQVVPSIIGEGEYEYSWLGISGTTLRPDLAEAMDLPRRTQGALVIDIVSDGPAENAGLAGSDETLELEGQELPIGGDIIVAIDGDTMETIDDVIAYLVSNTRPEQEVAMDILRNGERMQLTVKLGARPGP
ncbi:MAG: trypsin-like peptidase domain-containing protein [Chloroflexota bacterium]|nr:trypsin-like peptidase domain-containing protein [Chloroflexota bacterium]